MFVLVEMVDTVRIPPWQFERKLNDSIAEELNKKLANKVVYNVGLCICLFDITKLEDAYVFPGDGASHTKVHFRYVVFHPFLDEILIGKIKGCSPEGVHVSLGFFDDILIPPESLQQPAKFLHLICPRSTALPVRPTRAAGPPCLHLHRGCQAWFQLTSLRSPPSEAPDRPAAAPQLTSEGLALRVQGWLRSLFAGSPIVPVPTRALLHWGGCFCGCAPRLLTGRDPILSQLCPRCPAGDLAPSDEAEQVWVWEYETEEGAHDLYMDIGEEVRFRVVDESFVDTSPTGPSSAEASSSSEELPKKEAPYTLMVSCPDETWGREDPAGIHQRAGPGPPLLVDEQLALRCEHGPCPALGKEAQLALKTTATGSDEERRGAACTLPGCPLPCLSQSYPSATVPTDFCPLVTAKTFNK
ncbi:hypothetical protein Celaphus_00013754 [Cervus elaphus hippelaphus]|uniref:DNA-directed RNA polymerase subunit n=1 Tax=Cervus elaphus hippelaphus TaxID=46360 RepID=A0A212CCY2_CEREH|nr:hypothetical protein Celaphus_00013754 [Cervus elaphus hippelaphus]